MALFRDDEVDFLVFFTTLFYECATIAIKVIITQ